MSVVAPSFGLVERDAGSLSAPGQRTAGTTHQCAHCTLPVPAGMVEAKSERQFCCAGCRAVFATVTECGLADYYRLRDAAGAALSPATTAGQDKYEAFDSPPFEKLYVTGNEAGLASVDLFLEGVTCAACVWLVEKLPSLVPGVVEARLALRRATVRVTFDLQRVKLSQIARVLDSLGYTVHPAKGLSRESAYRKEYRARLVKLGAAGALMGNLMLLAAGLYSGWAEGMDAASSTMLRVLSLVLGMASLCWPGAEFFRSAWASLKTRTLNLDVPICIALATGGVAGVVNVLLGRGELYFDSLSALVFLLLIGRFLQFRQQRSAESAVELLFSLTPQFCRVVDEEGRVTELPIEGLREGQRVEVLAGGLVPADGVVEHGASTVDQALLTGESAPVTVTVGDEVFGGSQNGAASLRVRVTGVGERSRVGRLMQLLERGLSEKPQVVRFSDHVGVAFTFAVTVLGAVVFAYWARHDLSAAIDHTVAFLIVTCPCVLGLATPMTLAMAIGSLARRDILVRSGAAIEKLSATKPGRLILDKTGTLTMGALRVLRYEGDLQYRGLIARLEEKSTHPVGRALREAFERHEAPASLRGALSLPPQERTNGGISAELVSPDGPVTVLIGSADFMARHAVATGDTDETTHTTVYLALAGEVKASVILGDTLRPDTDTALSNLRAAGFQAEIRSGDSTSVVRHIARELDLPEHAAFGSQSPEMKLAAVHDAQTSGQTVMVGDGVNDAAALAAADVGIAVHGGSEVCLAAADVYVARPGLSPLVELIATARRTMTVIRRNFAVSLGYNLFAGTLAATGHMNPLVAAILMPMSSATVLSLSVYFMKQRNASTPTRQG